MTNTKWIALIVVFFALGVALGYSKPGGQIRSETKTVAAQSQASRKEIQTQAEAHKDVSTGLKTLFKKVYYCPNGNLKSETTEVVDYSKKETGVVARSNAVQQTEQTAIKTTETVISAPAPRWLIAPLVKASSGQVAALQGIVGMRTLGNLYVLGGISYDRPTGRTGFLFGAAITF